MTAGQHVLIAGGGIGGLSTALCLAKRGFAVQIFESAKTFDVHGAGIQISPNAMRILDWLGLAKKLRKLGTAPLGIHLRSAYSEGLLGTVALGETAVARYGVGYLSILRSDLHQVLASACKTHPDIELVMNRRVENFTMQAESVRLVTAAPGGNETIKGRFLVIADGMQSRLRKTIVGGQSAVRTGYEAWRAMLPAEKVPDFLDMNFVHACFGTKSHCVLYPVSAGCQLNMVFVKKTSGKDDTAGQIPIIANGEVTVLKQSLKNWSEHFRLLLEPELSWSVWPILAVPRLTKWGAGSALAIGDAAHGMVPYAAQGAAMVIEDGAVLAQIFKQTQNDVAANAGRANEVIIRRFHGARLARIDRVRRLANANGFLYHMGKPASHLRDLAIKAMPQNRLLSRQDWLYDWQL